MSTQSKLLALVLFDNLFSVDKLGPQKCSGDKILEIAVAQCKHKVSLVVPLHTTVDKKWQLTFHNNSTSFFYRYE